MQATRSLAATPVPGDVPALGVTDEGLGNTSWVVSLDGDGIVVDAERDPRPYLAALESLEAPPVLAADTHLHADFVTGSRELAALGATVAAPRGGDLRWPHLGMDDGEELTFGRWRLRALATPGHTPEHLSFVLRRDGRPRAVLTGGALLVGAVARTDLIDPDDTEALTRALYRSLHQRLLELPDEVLVLPTHGTGSFCSAAGGSRRWTTIGDERRSNPLLQADGEEDFVRRVLGAFGSYPPYFTRLRAVNRLGPAVYGVFPSLAPLTGSQAADLRDRGAVVVDARPVADYAAGHVPGALANPLRPQFASWLGWLVEDPGTPLVFVTGDGTDEAEIVRQCLNIGYERLAGKLTVDTWRAAGGELVSTPLVTPDQLDTRRVLDVRQAAEFGAGHVPGATHVELGSLPARVRELGEGPMVAMCGHGERAATAASLLEAAGRHAAAILAGGPQDWAAATGGDLERSEAAR